MTNEGNEMTAQETPSLYDRLVGVYSIATVIDDLIDRVMADDRLNANPRVDEAHHRVSPAGFKYYVTELACQAAGGPQQYSGRSMESRTAISGSPRRSGERSWTTFSRP
jgi:hemoglobin